MSRKRFKTMLGGAAAVAPEQARAVRRLADADRAAVEAASAVMGACVRAARADAAAVGARLEGARFTGESDADVAEMLALTAHAQGGLEVMQAMTIFLTSVGGPPSAENGAYEVRVPLFGPDEVAPFLTEPLTEHHAPCAEGPACYATRIPEWPAGRTLRALDLGDGAPPGLCILCHDFLVAKTVYQQADADPRWRFAPTDDGSTHTNGAPLTINRVQYRFGPGGFKPCLRLTSIELKPIPGVVGCAITPSLGHYRAVCRDGAWSLDDSPRHFVTPSA